MWTAMWTHLLEHSMEMERYDWSGIKMLEFDWSRKKRDFFDWCRRANFSLVQMNFWLLMIGLANIWSLVIGQDIFYIVDDWSIKREPA